MARTSFTLRSMINFTEYVDAHDSALRLISHECIAEYAMSIRKVFERGGILWTAGNGGSASNASHAQCDLSKGVFSKQHINPRVVCMSDMTETATAWANDESYEQGIANMCRNFVRQEDAILLISGSGNSQNIVNALNYAKESNIEIFAMTGFGGGSLRVGADHCLHVPSEDMQVVENIHLILIHWIFKVV